MMTVKDMFVRAFEGYLADEFAWTTWHTVGLIAVIVISLIFICWFYRKGWW